MMIVKFSGRSDDLIEVEMIDPTVAKVTFDELAAKSDGPTKILVQTIGGAIGCFVFANYDGCWHFSVRQLEEGRSLPSPWRITTYQDDDCAYSTILTIDATRPADQLDKPVVVR